MRSSRQQRVLVDEKTWAAEGTGREYRQLGDEYTRRDRGDLEVEVISHVLCGEMCPTREVINVGEDRHLDEIETGQVPTPSNRTS